jgi:pyochelin biosynthesis protein PchC
LKILPNAALPPGSCLRRMRAGARPLASLVCFPWCGAGASVFRRIASFMPDTLDVLAVQLPGREDRYLEAPYRRMDALAQHVAAALHAYAGGPLVLLGHSMGALVAYEVAHRLRAAGGEPAALVVSGHDAPQPIPPDAVRWHAASDDALRANLAVMGGTPAPVLADDGLFKALLRSLRADYEVLETHDVVPLEPLLCPVLVCAGRSDDSVSARGLAGWEELTRGPFNQHWFDGGHFHVSQEPAPLAAGLKAWLEAQLA